MVASELAAAGLPPARYFDAGIRFTVMLSQRTDNDETAAQPT